MNYHKEITDLTEISDYVRENTIIVLDVVLKYVAKNLEIDIYPTDNGTICIDVLKDYENEGIYIEVGKDSFGYFFEICGKDVSFVDEQKLDEDNCFDKLIIDLKDI